MFNKKFLKIDIYAMTWRLPIIVWQLLFFVGPSNFYDSHVVFSGKKLPND
jgi:hypothetical protein